MERMFGNSRHGLIEGQQANLRMVLEKCSALTLSSAVLGSGSEQHAAVAAAALLDSEQYAAVAGGLVILHIDDDPQLAQDTYAALKDINFCCTIMLL